MRGREIHFGGKSLGDLRYLFFQQNLNDFRTSLDICENSTVSDNTKTSVGLAKLIFTASRSHLSPSTGDLPKNGPVWHMGLLMQGIPTGILGPWGSF